ncbi:hypothetical protein BDA96_02G041200 [Sorghum bicolor]|uniref:Reverse transcriptase zinc-binding domain-containing protein n=1 Tax=Sorghum bicolor TaxID=4558 RepID=A0A921RL44_SORBI|nr:hypothetical protein BDA96_02G041200 [Sorghum bicolor]
MERVVSKVAELIDPHTRRWDEQLVKNIFWEEDVVNILGIPTHYDRDEMVAWQFNFNTKGEFSVKSACHVLGDAEEQQRERHRGEGSAMSATPKIKHFLWRVAHNRLASKLNIISTRDFVRDVLNLTSDISMSQGGCAIMDVAVFVSMVSDNIKMDTLGKDVQLVVTPQPKWCPPGRVPLKINFDGPFVHETNIGAWGFIVGMFGSTY